MKKLLEMLTYRRPAGSPTERAFIERYIMPFKPKMLAQNLVVVVPGDPGTLFSCHTDTMHRDHAMQKVVFDENLGIAWKDDEEPLGADNTAGVWLLLEMLEAGVPGTYVFHFGEEKGCLGSKQMAKDHAKWLQGFERAIAFDRRGTNSVITHQMGDRTCSDTFGHALASALGGSYECDRTGLYTDTSCYAHLIPECTNVSVGYEHEHGPMESLDIEHLLWLRDVVLGVNWSSLPTIRAPLEDENLRDRKYNFGSTKFTGLDYEIGDFEDPTEVERLITLARMELRDIEDCYELAEDEPYLLAQMLYAHLIRVDELEPDKVSHEDATQSE